MFRALFLIVLLVSTPAAFAQSFPDFDTSGTFYAPQRVALDGCGFSIGIDPRWTHEVSRDQDGDIRHSIDNFDLEQHIGGLYPFFVSATTTMDIVCAPTDPQYSSASFMQTWAQMMYDDAGDGRGFAGKTPLQAFSAPGFRHAWTYTVQREGSLNNSDRYISADAFVFGYHGGVDVTINIVQLSNIPGGSTQPLAAGTRVQIEHERGQFLTGRITHPVMQRPDGSMYPVRTMAQERAFINTILATIR